MSFEAEIPKEHRDKFFAHFDKGLNELVVYENSQYRRPQTLEMSGLNDKINNSYLNNNRKKFDPFKDPNFEISPQDDNKRKWIYYFEESSKNFYYLDCRQKSRSFEKVTLQIPFNIFPNHRSIMTSDGEIYIVGGYNGFIKESNESDFLYIYKLDILNKTLIPLEKMYTLRHSFGIANVRNKIFVVGGSNYREGSLIKCESFDLKTLKWTRNNYLNIRSMEHTLVTYKDTYIFKIGGLRKKLGSIELCYDLFERYDISFDIWEKMKLKDSNNLTFSITYLSGCYSINENNILIFGGKNEKNDVLKQAFIINFSKNELGGFSEKLEENSFSIIEINSKPLPLGVYFTNPNFIVSGKILYVCGYSNEKELKVLSFDQKNWKNFLN